MMNVWTDLKRGCLTLRKKPGFAVVIVVCLGLAIGANTVSFSLANAILFHRLPVDRPEDLVRAFVSYEGGLRWGTFSYPDFADYAEQGRGVIELAGEKIQPVNLSVDGHGERLFGSLVSGNYFQTLGLRAAAGRLISPSDAGAGDVAVLSHALWLRRFSGDLGWIGRTILLNGRSVTIVGIAPPAFTGAYVGFQPALWLPISLEPQLNLGSQLLQDRKTRSLLALGRLAPGISREQAQAAMKVVARQLAAAHPEDEGISITLIPEAEGALYPTYRGAAQGALGGLQAVVFLVLLIACANAGMLLAARAAERQREVGIRLALGVSQKRLVCQFLAESLVPSIGAGALGLAVAVTLLHFLAAFKPTLDLPLAIEVGLDQRALLFTVGICWFTCLLFGLLPAWFSTRVRLVAALKDGSVSSFERRSRLQSGLVVLQIMSSCVLLVAISLLLQGLRRAQTVDLGFQPDGVMVATVDLGSHGYDRSRGRRFYQGVLDEVQKLPQVQAAALATILPLSPIGNQIEAVPEGFVRTAVRDSLLVDYAIVGAGYFEALGIPILTGRGFAASDRFSSSLILIINEALAQRYWPGEDPLGRRLTLGGVSAEVVGVVGNSKYTSLGETAKGYVYLPFEQHYQGTMNILVKSSLDLSGLQQSVQEIIRRQDPALAVFGAQTLLQHLAVSLLPARALLAVLSSFGLLAIVLAAVGLYGLLAYHVSQKQREIAIRIALGARRRNVLAATLRPTCWIIGVGTVLGLVVAAAVARLLTVFLYGASPYHPTAFALGGLLMVAIALLASLFPVRRILAIHPASTLRGE